MVIFEFCGMASETIRLSDLTCDPHSVFVAEMFVVVFFLFLPEKMTRSPYNRSSIHYKQT